MTGEQFRQGDLLIIKVDKLPKDSHKKNFEKDIILKGEATNHAHRLVGGDIHSHFGLNRETDMYLNVPKGGEITHEEHGTIKLEPGVFKVIRQVEYGVRRNTFVLD